MKYLFWLFILLLPSQLGKHWWPEWSLVEGVRVDYLSPTVYLTDVIIIFLMVSIGINHKSEIINHISKRRGAAILFMISYILFMIWRSARPWLGVYWTARYLEIILVAAVTKIVLRGDSSAAKGGLRMTGLLLAGGVIFSVGLGIIQMFLGRTTGRFWILGERSFTLADPGIATMTIWGREILRPYATFPHPNALGGFLAAATLLFIKVQPLQPQRLNLLATMTGIAGVILTGSRGAAAGLIIAILLNCYIAKKLKPVIVLGGLLGLGILGIAGAAGASENERVILAGAAGRMFGENWVTGVGAGQFLAKLPEYLPQGFYKIQPVHNVFLLGPAEFGAAAVIGLIGLIRLIRQMNYRLNLKRWTPLLAVILVTGTVDHYWLTAQQNRLLLGLILGVMWKKGN